MTDADREPTGPVIHVVEDGESTRLATSRFLRVSGYAVRTYATAGEFLAALPIDEPGCVLMDLRLPGASGLQLQKRLTESGDPLPIIFLTGHGQIRDSVQAVRSGAVDFLTKPADAQTLLDAIHRAVEQNTSDRATLSRKRDLQRRYALLTAREREVFAHLISGQLNKQVGFDLGITERTIKIHRQQVLEKMAADSIADLARMAIDLHITPVGRVK
jgi:FixJ family two-component response regulator